MTRPCTCDRFTPGDYRPGDCRLCWLAAHDERYRRLWSGDGPATVATPIPLPCVHEGHTCPPPPGREYDGKAYLRCDAGKGDPPGVVCRCQCGPGCDGYEGEG